MPRRQALAPLLALVAAPLFGACLSGPPPAPPPPVTPTPTVTVLTSIRSEITWVGTDEDRARLARELELAIKLHAIQHTLKSGRDIRDQLITLDGLDWNADSTEGARAYRELVTACRSKLRPQGTYDFPGWAEYEPVQRKSSEACAEVELFEGSVRTPGRWRSTTRQLDKLLPDLDALLAAVPRIGTEELADRLRALR